MNLVVQGSKFNGRFCQPQEDLLTLLQCYFALTWWPVSTGEAVHPGMALQLSYSWLVEC